MKQIKFTDGCPNGCEYCKETTYMQYSNPEIPEGDFKILDMNFLANPFCKKILIRLLNHYGKKEFVCGVDYRRMTQEIANLIYAAQFINIRWAWDGYFNIQREQNKVWKMFKKAGYRNEDLMIFMICDWKISYHECLKKLDLLKIWNVKVSDCWYDGVVSPNFQCNYWTLKQCKDFRQRCRKHNQMVLFKIDPELKSF